MKPKIKPDLASNAPDESELPVAYDLDTEQRRCRQLQVPCKRAVAWMEGGRVHISVLKSKSDKVNLRSKRDAMFLRWVKESGLLDNAELETESPIKANQLIPEYVRCLAVSNGEAWHCWRPSEVGAVLTFSQETPPGRRFQIIPLENTIFDPDKAPLVWRTKDETPLADRCVLFGRKLLFEAARVYATGVKFIEGFEGEFEEMSKYPHSVEGTLPVRLLIDSKNRIFAMISNIALLKYRPNLELDLEVALRQGFLIGRWLAQAEAIISSSGFTKFAAQQANSGQKTSLFLRWIIDLQDSCLKGLTASQIFSWLDGKDDPEFKGHKLIVKDDELQRGNGRIMKMATFQASLSRAKKRAREKVS
ncbi:hypothetical protein [Prosthecobacter fluviatilis]|uniref:Uncharacterized protein n=1 Tax=Prosthecobacter fluviatilis TaxID=445931 RepID=A0ABW0KTU5_9BACT